MFKLFTHSYLGFIAKAELRDWLVEFLYRIDTGLHEIEKDYEKKFPRSWKKKVEIDRNYNQLRGKFTVTLCLFQDFNVPLPRVGDRIEKRIALVGGKLKRK